MSDPESSGCNYNFQALPHDEKNIIFFLCHIFYPGMTGLGIYDFSKNQNFEILSLSTISDDIKGSRRAPTLKFYKKEDFTKINQISQKNNDFFLTSYSREPLILCTPYFVMYPLFCTIFRF